MKKLILLLFLASLMPVSVKSQALIALLLGDKIQSDKVKMGLFLGEQGSLITGAETSGFNPNLSFALGAYVDVKMGNSDKWTLQNYLLFKSPKGGAGLNVNSEALTDNLVVLINSDKLQRSLTYMQLTPVMRYRLTPIWAVGVGPYMGYLVKANDIYTAEKAGGDVSFKLKAADQFNSVDYGLVVDLQHRLLKGKGVQFNLRYEYGLANIYKSSTGMNGKNMAFHVGVGIPMEKK